VLSITVVVLTWFLRVESQFSVAEAKRIVEKDWNKDVGSDPTIVMTKDMFTRALFEVVRHESLLQWASSADNSPCAAYDCTTMRRLTSGQLGLAATSTRRS